MAKKNIPLCVSAAPLVKESVYVGIDQSLTNSGVSVFDESGNLLGTKLISTKPGINPMGEVERYVGIFETFKKFVSSFSPKNTCVLMEDFAFSQQNHMAALGGLGWYIRICMGKNTDWHFGTCPVGTLKMFASGKGNSKKEEMLLAVYKRWKFEGDDNNVVDSYALGKLCWTAYAKPLPSSETGVTKTDLECVQKLTIYR
jgi:crossover junction endodeoxyribonuclease RuvC